MNLLAGFDLVITDTDGTIMTVHTLWADTIFHAYQSLIAAIDVKAFEAIDCETGEVMCHYDADSEEPPYVCEEWKKWGLH